MLLEVYHEFLYVFCIPWVFNENTIAVALLAQGAPSISRMQFVGAAGCHFKHFFVGTEGFQFISILPRICFCNVSCCCTIFFCKSPFCSTIWEFMIIPHALCHSNLWCPTLPSILYLKQLVIKEQNPWHGFELDFPRLMRHGTYHRSRVKKCDVKHEDLRIWRLFWLPMALTS